MTPTEKLDKVREIVAGYYAALLRRDNPHFARDRALKAIEEVIGMDYDAYAAKARKRKHL
jgi:hypothetical protein